MHDVQSLSNAHLLGKAGGKNGLERDTEPQGIQTTPAWGCIPPAAREGLEKPKMKLWSHGQSKIFFFFSYLQFLLSVQGAQAIHPSQEDPVAENQGERQRHQMLVNKAVTEMESALLATAIPQGNGGAEP